MVWRSVGDPLEDGFDVRHEAEVEHLVGLVEDEGAHGGKVEVALAGQVEQPARGADDDFDAGPQRLDLRLIRAAAVDGEHPGAEQATGALEVFGDLNAQLTGRNDDERERLAAFGVSAAPGRDPLQQGDAERERLAGAGARLADDIGAFERHGEGERLNGERRGDAGLGKGRHDRGADAERGEISG